jgi:hypothetical protein
VAVTARRRTWEYPGSAQRVAAAAGSLGIADAAIRLLSGASPRLTTRFVAPTQRESPLVDAGIGATGRPIYHLPWVTMCAQMASIRAAH